MAAVLLGLVCAFLIGIANFTGGVVSKRDASLTIAFVGQLTTVPVMALVLLFVPASSFTLSDVAWGLASGVIQVTGLRLLWQAMSVGKMGLLAAINATMAAVVPAIWAVTRGEEFGVAATFGAALALTSIVMIVRSPGDATMVLHHRKQALTAGLAGTCFGLSYIALAYPAKSSSVIPLLASRSSGALVGGVMIAMTGGRYWISRDNPLGLLPGMFGVASLVLFVVASHHHMVATVSVVQALAPLFTALLAFFVLHQRLRALQSLGLAVALASAVLLAL